MIDNLLVDDIHRSYDDDTEEVDGKLVVIRWELLLTLILIN